MDGATGDAVGVSPQVTPMHRVKELLGLTPGSTHSKRAKADRSKYSSKKLPDVPLTVTTSRNIHVAASPRSPSNSPGRNRAALPPPPKNGIFGRTTRAKERENQQGHRSPWVGEKVKLQRKREKEKKKSKKKKGHAVDADDLQQ